MLAVAQKAAAERLGLSKEASETDKKTDDPVKKLEPVKESEKP